MDNHLYVFGDQLYHQTSGGGPIGLKVTGVLARLLMLYWDKEYLGKLATMGIVPFMYQRYIDDLNIFTRSLSVGEDDAEGVEVDEKTAKKIREVANTVRPRSIVMEEDYPSKHEVKTIPVLDMKFRVQDRRTVLSLHPRRRQSSWRKGQEF